MADALKQEKLEDGDAEKGADAGDGPDDAEKGADAGADDPDFDFEEEATGADELQKNFEEDAKAEEEEVTGICKLTSPANRYFVMESVVDWKRFFGWLERRTI